MISSFSKLLAAWVVLICPATPLAQNWSKTGNIGLPRTVRAMYADSNYLYAGMQSGGSYSNNIRIWNGSQWDTLLNPCIIGGYPTSMVEYQGYMVAATNCGGVLKWTGTNWSTIGLANNAITCLWKEANDLYAVGWFDTISGVAASRVAKWDGMSWSAIDTTQWNGGAVSAVIVYNGDLYIAGNMWNFDASLDRIARWNGTQWLPVGNGIIGGVAGVYSMAIYSNELYVGGFFTLSGGNPGNCIAKWNGSNWSDVGGGMTGIANINSLRVFNNELYAGGGFFQAGGAPINFLAKWNGTLWCGLGIDYDSTSSGVFAIESYKGELYIGGAFKTINSDTMNYVAKWTGGNFTDTCGTLTGIKQWPLENSISLYPNPATNEIFIKTEGINDLQNSAIRIQNTLGQIVRSLSFTQELDISEFTKGFYFLQIVSSKGQVYRARFFKE